MDIHTCSNHYSVLVKFYFALNMHSEGYCVCLCICLSHYFSGTVSLHVEMKVPTALVCHWAGKKVLAYPDILRTNI